MSTKSHCVRWPVGVSLGDSLSTLIEDADWSTPHHTLGLGSKLYRSIDSELSISAHARVFILFGFDCECDELSGLPCSKLLFRGIFITVTDSDAFLLGGQGALPQSSSHPWPPAQPHTWENHSSSQPQWPCRRMSLGMTPRDIEVDAVKDKHPSCQLLLKNNVHLHCYRCLFSKVKKWIIIWKYQIPPIPRFLYGQGMAPRNISVVWIGLTMPLLDNLFNLPEP